MGLLDSTGLRKSVDDAVSETKEEAEEKEDEEEQEDAKPLSMQLKELKRDLENFRETQKEIYQRTEKLSRIVEDEDDQELKNVEIEEKVDKNELKEEVRQIKDDVVDLRNLENKIERIEIQQDINRSELKDDLKRTREKAIEEAAHLVNGKADQADLEEVSSQLGELHGELANDVAIIQETVSKLDERITDLSVEEKVDREELKQEIQKAKDEIGVEIVSLESRLEEKFAEKSQVRGIWETLDLYDDKHQDIESNITDVRGDVARLEDNFRIVQNQVSAISDKLKRVKIEEKVDRTELEEELEKIRESIEKVSEERIEGIEGRLKDIEENRGSELENLKKDITSELYQKLDTRELAGQVNRLSKRLETVRKGPDKEDIEEIRERLDKVQNQDNQELEEEVGKIKKRIQSLQEKVEENSSKDLSSIKSKIREIESNSVSKSEFKGIKSTMEDMRNEIDTLDSKVGSKKFVTQEDMDNLKHKIDDLEEKQESREIQEKIEGVKSQMVTEDQLKKELQKQEPEISRKEFEKLRNEVQKLSEVMKALGNELNQ